MREINIKLLLPYNWGHIRKIKIYDNKKQLITKIMHGEELTLNIDSDIEEVIIKLDFYKSVIKIPKNEKVYLGLYMDFRDRFPFKYLDTLKRKCLTGRFMTEQEYENFNLSFYAESFRWVPKAGIDKPTVFLGLLLSVAIVALSIIQQHNPYQDIVFFIGASGTISLALLYFEKDKVELYDYRNRMIASGCSFILAGLLASSSLSAGALLVILGFTFILRSVAGVKRLFNAANLT